MGESYRSAEKKVNSTPGGVMGRRAEKSVPVFGELHEEANLFHHSKPGGRKDFFVQEEPQALSQKIRGTTDNEYEHFGELQQKKTGAENTMSSQYLFQSSHTGLFNRSVLISWRISYSVSLFLVITRKGL